MNFKWSLICCISRANQQGCAHEMKHILKCWWRRAGRPKSRLSNIIIEFSSICMWIGAWNVWPCTLAASQRAHGKKSVHWTQMQIRLRYLSRRSNHIDVLYFSPLYHRHRGNTKCVARRTILAERVNCWPNRIKSFPVTNETLISRGSH